MAELQITGREAIADWIELTLIARGGYLGHDAIFAFAKEELGVSEAQASHALSVLKTRSQMLGDSYPLMVNDFSVHATTGCRSLVYSMLLLLSPDNLVRQLVHSKPTSEMAVVFERIAVVAMVSLLGESGKAIRFGWPSDDGRPVAFNDAIEWLAGKMGIRSGAAYRPPRRKDGGVDVVAWRPFPDRRSGFPVYLLQCTLQSEILSKSADIDVRYWSGWLTLDAEPFAVLAIPGIVSNENVWAEISVRCLILDRVRLAGLLSKVRLEHISGGEKLVKELFEKITPLLRGAEK